MMRRISVRAIVLDRDGKLLCARLKRYPGALSVSEDEWWCLPGGGLDEGEALLDGVRREMLEETGIEAVVGDLLYVQQFQHGDKDYLEFFFHVTNAEDYRQIDLSKTTHGAAEIEEIAFIDPKEKHVLPALLKTEGLIEQAKNGRAKFFSYYK
jgi:ADP-ribose pyrophosphatase YjhB (NUDIX family)